MNSNASMAVAAIRQLIQEQGLGAAIQALPNMANLVAKPTDSVLLAVQRAIEQEVLRLQGPDRQQAVAMLRSQGPGDVYANNGKTLIPELQ